MEATSLLYTLLWHWNFFQAKNWMLMHKTQQLIIQARFHSCHQIPQGAATLLLTYKPIFLGGPVSPRLFHPLSKVSRRLGWCRLMTETLSARSSPTWWSSRTDVGKGNKQQLFCWCRIHSLRARWAGQGDFSIWTHWYIPLLLILVIALCSNQVPDLRKSGTQVSII